MSEWEELTPKEDFEQYGIEEVVNGYVTNGEAQDVILDYIEKLKREIEKCYRDLEELQQDKADLEKLCFDLRKENENMKQYIKNGIEFGYIDDREGNYKKFI